MTLILAALLSFAGPLAAQSSSAPLGLFLPGAYDNNGAYVGLLANSDTFVSLPFTRNPEFYGTTQSVSGNIVTVSGTPGWTNSQFVYAKGTQPKTYYVLIGPGPSGTSDPKEGCVYPVTANTPNTLTLNLNGDVITSIPAGSQISIIPYWTLATIFPATNAAFSFTPTTTTRNLQTEILIPNYGARGVNLAYSATYFFLNSGTNVGWRLYGDALTTDHGDDILDPSGYLVVRNINGAPTLPLTITGAVLAGKVTIPQATLATQYQDNDVAMIRPLDVSLDDTDLAMTGSFAPTTSTRNIQDELFLYNNYQVAINKSPSATYYYMNNAWRLFGDKPTNDHGTDMIPAGSGLTIRKAPSGSGSTEFWQNTANY
jgi:uncharacterized protein (TIGR02597 family)